MEPVANTSESSAERLRSHLGTPAADDLRRALDALELVVVDAGELAELRRRAAAYERLRNLVEGPDEPIR